MNTPDKKTIDNGGLTVPSQLTSGFINSVYFQNKMDKKLLFKVSGNIGDQICAEPTIRYALSQFHDCEVSLSSEIPALFRHLNLDKVFDESVSKPDYQKFIIFETIVPPDDSAVPGHSFSKMFTNCVDFPSLCSLRGQIPVKDKEIMIKGSKPFVSESDLGENPIFINAGNFRPFSNFQKEWWEETIQEIYNKELTPVLIDVDSENSIGNFDLDATNCLDLRGKLSLLDTIWLLQRAKVLLTNDSSAVHMAASQDPYSLKSTGHCFTNFITTGTHPDHLMHWRKGKWAFRESNLSVGGVWDLSNSYQADENILQSWLPKPIRVAEKVLSSHFAYWAQ